MWSGVIEISFSFEVREEMAGSLPEKECCREALLAAALIFAGDFPSEGSCPTAKTGFPRFARLIFKLVKEFSASPVKWETARERYLNKRKIYSIEIPQSRDMNNFLCRWGIPEKLKRKYIRKCCCKRAFLRGAFLSSGSMSSPRKYYHLEIASSKMDPVRVLVKILERMDISAKILARKNRHVIYVKKSDDIAYILNITGAYRSLLKFEEIRAIKETREEVRRRVNCETANLDKSVQAAIRQVYNINFLKKAGILNKLPKKLQEIANLRMEFPQVSLRELGEHLSPPIAKSTVNNRFRRIETMVISKGGFPPNRREGNL